MDFYKTELNIINKIDDILCIIAFILFVTSLGLAMINIISFDTAMICVFGVFCVVVINSIICHIKRKNIYRFISNKLY